MSRGKRLVELALLKFEQEKNKDQNEDIQPLEDDKGRCDGPESDAESEHSLHNTDTDQTDCEENKGNEGVQEQESFDESGELMDGNTDDTFFQNAPIYIGKDKVTKWLKHDPTIRGRTRRHNLVTHMPGVKGLARNAKTPLECWKLFFPDASVQEVVDCTNEYLRIKRNNYSRERDCADTNFYELSALIGLLYLAGIKKSSHINISELWTDDGTAPECFRATMSQRRFYTLLSALRFDDIHDRDVRKASDNLAPIRKQFDDFVQFCKSHYTLGEYGTVDEMLEAFKGRCKFRQYIANKPAKYGIKIYALVDSRSFYTSNLEIYAGKQPESQYKMENTAFSVVKRIIEPILNTGRNVTMDNYFTSIPLAKDLKLNHNITIVGTLRKNKKEIPLQLSNIKERPFLSSMFAFSKESVLVSYVPQKTTKKNVLLLSTMHNGAVINEETGDQVKPEIITFYNLTKGAVDVVDEMKALYSVARISCRWPLTIYFSMLNIGGINSFIIYKANHINDPIPPRRAYLKELALLLIKPHLISRSQITNLPYSLRTSIRKIAKLPPEEVRQPENVNESFCSFCPRRKNRKVKKVCRTCQRPICPEHTIFSCRICTSEMEPDEDL